MHVAHLTPGTAHLKSWVRALAVKLDMWSVVCGECIVRIGF